MSTSAVLALINLALAVAAVAWAVWRVRRADSRSRESELRSHAVVDATQQTVWTSGGREESDAIAWWSELTGQTRAESAGWGWIDALHPDDRDRTRSDWEKSLRDGSRYEIEYRIRTRTGEYRWYAARGVPLFDDNGKFQEWVGTLLDVDDRKRSEERLREWNASLEQRIAERTAELQESERRFRAIFHAQFQFIGLMSPDGILLEANRTALAAAGVDGSDVIGVPFWDTVWWRHDATQRERLKEAVRKAAAGEQDRFEASHPAADGSIIWVDFSLTPFRDDDGRVVLLIPEGRDITARKRAEEELAHKTLVFETVLDSMSDAVLVADRDGHVLLRNRAFDRLHASAGDRNPVGADTPRDFGVYLPGGKELCPPALLPINRAIRGEPTDDVELEIVDEAHPDSLPISVNGRPLVGPEGLSGGVIVIHDISARHRAEATLRDSVTFGRGILDSLQAHIAVIDRFGTITAVNRGWEAFSHENRRADGVRARTGVGVNYLEVCDAGTAKACSDAREAAAAIRRVLTGGGPWSGLEYDCHGPREKRWFSMSVSPLDTPEGGAVVSHTDITPRKLAEQAVRESEDRFRGAFEHAPIGMSLVAPDGRWLMVNHALCDLVGYTEAELLATDFQTITHPDDLDGDLALVRQVLNGSIATYQLEKRYFHKTGRVVQILLSVSLVRDPAGRPLYFVAQMKDITERKRNEAALRAGEERYRTVIESLAEGVVLQDENAAIVTANRRACEILGLTVDQMCGRTSLDPRWGAFRPDGSPFPGEEHPAPLALRTGEPVFNVVMSVSRPDGDRRWINVNAVPFGLTPEGRPGGVVASFHDITEARRLDERVRASLKEKEVLLKEIHHRVKNNLQIVSSLLDLQSEHTRDPDALTMFKESRGRVKSMAMIHERLYRSQDMARVNVAEYIDQLARDLYRAYRVSEDEIRLEIDVDVPPLSIDVAIPCGLLLNELMSNCFKHAFRDRENGVLRVGLHREGGENVLSVADDGPGFPPGTDFRNTTSFGLQLVNTLAEQLDGEVELTSDRGTTFTVRFPAGPL